MELALITGHNSGLGAALWYQAKQLGMARLGVSRRKIEGHDQDTLSLAIDLSAGEPWEQSLDRALEAWSADPWSKIYLISSAAQLGPVAPLLQLQPAELLAAYQLNVLAPLRLMRWANLRWPHTALRVANISSGAATKPYQAWTSYCSTKAALRMGTQVAAAEALSRGADVRFISYSPGVLDTPMQDQVRGLDPHTFPDRDRFVQLHERGLLVSPDAAAGDLWERLRDERQAYYTECRFGEGAVVEAGPKV